MLSVPLQVLPSSYFAFPYIVALFAFCFAALILLWRFPGLREYHRKRNKVIYASMLVVLLSLSLQIGNVSSRALIDYSVGTDSTKIYLGTSNQIGISAANHGDRSISFYIIVRGENASFQHEPQQSYALIDNRTIKVPFQLQGISHSQGKMARFTVDDNVRAFTFSASFETSDMQYVTVMSGITSISFEWNDTEGCYVPGIMSGFVV